MSRPSNEVVPGPTSRYVIENVKRLRAEQRLSREQLSDRLTDVGRPIRATGLARLESGRRRIDVDDLMGLAAAFGVSPISLLVPRTAGGEIELTESRFLPAREAWAWLRAQRPLEVPEDDDGFALMEFQRRALPRELRNYDLNSQVGAVEMTALLREAESTGTHTREERADGEHRETP